MKIQEALRYLDSREDFFEAKLVRMDDIQHKWMFALYGDQDYAGWGETPEEAII